MEQEFSPPNHPVFELVPPEFEQIIAIFYEELGSPTVEKATFWTIYNNLVYRFRNAQDLPAMAYKEPDWSQHEIGPSFDFSEYGEFTDTEEEVGDEDLREYADFSDEEDNEEEDGSQTNTDK